MKQRSAIKRIVCAGLSVILMIMVSSCGMKSANFKEVESEGTGQALNATGTANNSDKAAESQYIFPAAEIGEGTVKWGYKDIQGNWIIEPRFEQADEFQENGLAKVVINNMTGIIDRKGNFVIPPEYDYISEFSEGLTVASGSKGYHLFNESGKKVFQSNGYIGQMKDGLAVFAVIDADKSYKYGYVNKNGEVVIKAEYEYAENFEGDKALVKSSSGYKLINKSGEVVSSFTYPYVANYGEGLLSFREKTLGEAGYIDEEGNVVLPAIYQQVNKFSDGVAIVSVESSFVPGAFGLINKKGEYIIPPQFGSIRKVGNGLYAAGKPLNPDIPFINFIYALFDKEGKQLTDFKFNSISSFNNGVASVREDMRTYFIDETGKMAEDLPVVEGVGTLTLNGDTIKAVIDKRQALLDKKGNVIWKETNEFPLGNEITVREEKYRPSANIIIYYPVVSGLPDKTTEKQINDKLKELSIPAGESGEDEKSWIEQTKDAEYTGDFGVAFYKKNLLNIRLSSYYFPYGAAHGMPTQAYVHVDLNTGRIFELKDLFKKDADYVTRISALVQKQIAAMSQDAMIWPDHYKGIRENQPFIITENELHVYFFPYEIAPYAAGFPTFAIPYSEIIDLIDTQGELWKAFND